MLEIVPKAGGPKAARSPGETALKPSTWRSFFEEICAGDIYAGALRPPPIMAAAGRAGKESECQAADR